MIHIQTVSSESFDIEIRPDAKVLDMKVSINSTLGIPVETQRLFCEGQEDILNDDDSISGSNLVDGDSVTLLTYEEDAWTRFLRMKACIEPLDCDLLAQIAPLSFEEHAQCITNAISCRDPFIIKQNTPAKVKWKGRRKGKACIVTRAVKVEDSDTEGLGWSNRYNVVYDDGTEECRLEVNRFKDLQNMPNVQARRPLSIDLLSQAIYNIYSWPPDQYVQAVRVLLDSAGCNPNFASKEGVNQPNSPLKLVVFMASDCMLSDAQQIALAEVARLLIAHNANPLPAEELATSRYGVHCPGSAVTVVREAAALA